MSFFPWIFGLAVDIAWPDDPHDFLFFVLSWIHFSSSVTIRCKKFFRLCLASSISHVKNRRSTFLGFSSYGTQFPCFWIIPNDFKRYEIVCWVTPNVSTSSFCVWHESSSNNASNSASSYTFGLPLRSLSSTFKFLNFWNHSRQLLSLKAASLFYKQSMSFSCRFLQIKEVNRKFPQMTLIRLKTRHFCTKKNIWCWYKIANISRL